MDINNYISALIHNDKQIRNKNKQIGEDCDAFKLPTKCIIFYKSQLENKVKI